MIEEFGTLAQMMIRNILMLAALFWSATSHAQNPLTTQKTFSTLPKCPTRSACSVFEGIFAAQICASRRSRPCKLKHHQYAGKLPEPQHIRNNSKSCLPHHPSAQTCASSRSPPCTRGNSAGPKASEAIQKHSVPRHPSARTCASSRSPPCRRRAPR